MGGHEAAGGDDMSTANESLEKRVQRLEDERAIQDVIYSYAWGTDQKRKGQWLDIWAEDAVLNFGPAPGTTLGTAMREPVVGRAALERFYDNRPGRDISPKHVTVNSLISVDGDGASAESYIVFFLEREGVPELVSTGRYIDKLKRCADGKWRIRERLAHMDTLKTEFFPGAAKA
jgi:ketosteroid isomerase-like protein